LGSAFALECARRGRNLILIDIYHDANDLEYYLQHQFPIQTHYFQCNLSKTEERQNLFTLFSDSAFEFDGLINVVGQEMEGPFLERTRDEVLYMTRLNIETMVDLSLFALGRRSLSKRFHLVNVASLAGFFPMPNKALYAATKRMIIQFSLGLREEIRDFGNVTVLCPGGVPTNAEAMRKIFLQGFWGKMTSHDISDIVQKTMDRVEKNRPLYIPGLANRFLVWISQLVPLPWTARYLGRRWGHKQADLEVWRLANNKRTQ
jgi:short-subunit dehydrogenase